MAQKKISSSIQLQEEQDALFKQFLQKVTFETSKYQLGWTNSVLAEVVKHKLQKKKKSVQLYLPGYLRLKIKNFVSIALSDKSSTLNCTILFTFYYGNLPKPVVNSLKNKFVINLIRNQSISLKCDSNSVQSGESKCQMIQNEFQSTIQYKIRKQVDLSFFPHISSSKHIPQGCMNQFDNSLWYSPFQIIDQVLTIQIPRIIISKEDFNQNCKCNCKDQNYSKNNGNNAQKFTSKHQNIDPIDLNLSCWQKFIKKILSVQNKESKQYQTINHIGISINLMDLPNKILRQQHNVWMTSFANQDLNKSEKKNKYRQFRADDCEKLDIRKQPILGIYGLASKLVQTFCSNKNYSKIYQQRRYQAEMSAETVEKLDRQQKQMQKGIFDSNNNQECQTNRCLRNSLDDFCKPTKFSVSTTTSQKRKNQITKSVWSKKQKRQISTEREHEKHFLNAHFVIPVYKFPGVSIITIFFPLWLLAILNLAIYFQSTDFGNRTVSIGTLVIAYVGLISVIRGQIPPYSGVLMVQILVYSQTFTNLLCLLESFWLRYENKNALNFFEAGPFLYISIGISLFSLILILFLYILHKTKWEKEYAYQKNSKFKTTAAEYCKPKKLNILHWQNERCDLFFQKKKNKIQLLNSLFPQNNFCCDQTKIKSVQTISSSLPSLKFQSRTSLSNNIIQKQNV